MVPVEKIRLRRLALSRYDGWIWITVGKKNRGIKFGTKFLPGPLDEWKWQKQKPKKELTENQKPKKEFHVDSVADDVDIPPINPWHSLNLWMLKAVFQAAQAAITKMPCTE